MHLRTGDAQDEPHYYTGERSWGESERVKLAPWEPCTSGAEISSLPELKGRSVAGEEEEWVLGGEPAMDSVSFPPLVLSPDSY